MTRAASPPPRRGRYLFAYGQLPPVELVEGAEVGLFFRQRSRCPKVGRVLAVRRRTVVLAPWGRSDTAVVELAEIAFFRLVARHDWVQWHEVSKRQRRGECGVGP